MPQVGVAEAAVDEAVDVLALTDHTGSMIYIAGAVIKALKKYGVSDICVVAGGLIPKKDIPILEKMWVTGNFGPDTPLDIIINHVVTVAGGANTKERYPVVK